MNGTREGIQHLQRAVCAARGQHALHSMADQRLQRLPAAQHRDRLHSQPGPGAGAGLRSTSLLDLAELLSGHVKRVAHVRHLRSRAMSKALWNVRARPCARTEP
jgi:hypothetical protein